MVDEDPALVPDWIPDLSQEKAEHGRKFIWLHKGSRPGIGISVHRITTRYACWTRVEDKLVWRLYGFLKTYPNFGAMLRADPQDLPFLLVNLRTDSDHCNDIPTTKNTSGALTALRGPCGTYALMECLINRQVATGKNTADCETASLDTGVFRSGLPMVGLMEKILGRPVRLWAEEDITTSIGAITLGFSPRLSCLEKTQLVCLGALHKVFFR